MNDAAQNQPVVQDPSLVGAQTPIVPDEAVQPSGGTQTSGASQPGGDLNTFGDILQEVGSVAPQSVASAISNATNTLNPDNPARTAKEKLQSTAVLDSAPIEMGGNPQAVEVEKLPEISPEVESFLHRVEDHADQAPKEIVIADGTVESSKTNYPSTPVVVLPITHEEEEEGRKKSPKFSFRWLVEWSDKVIKLFAGKAIYRKEE